MTTEMHELREVIQGRSGGARTFEARCSCGWRSDVRPSEREADDDHVAHRLAEIPDDDPRSV